MNRTKLIAIVVAGAVLAACDSGDIVLAPTTIDNSMNIGGGGGGPTTSCALYESGGQTVAGIEDADGNCVYDASFVSRDNPILTDITFPLLEGGRVHIFEDSLFVGADVNAQAAANGTRVPQDGEGPTLTIRAGNTMVFRDADSYVRIARGSRLIAIGTASQPITFTADEDALLNVATESDRGLWGGIQINGNGITNKCNDGTPTGNNPGAPNDFEPTGVNPHNCHQPSEGLPGTYGGNNNDESSGALVYVVIKHAGFDVLPGDELNSLTLNAVGRGTRISYVQTYTSQDDGFEMFGGAVNLDHIVAVNVGDDSIDWSEGYQGDVQYAVVLHTSGADQCLEGDNTGEGRGDGITPRTLLRISNLTCIMSEVPRGKGANPSSKGNSEGPLLREGVFFEIYNSVFTTNESWDKTTTGTERQECLLVDDSEGPETIAGITDGTSKYSSNVMACALSLGVGDVDPGNAPFDATSLLNWMNGDAPPAGNTNANNIVDDAPGAAASVVPYTGLIDNAGGTNRGYLTIAPPFLDSSGADVGFDYATDLTDVNAINSSFFVTPTYVGGAGTGDDWLDGWTVGIGSGLLLPDNTFDPNN